MPRSADTSKSTIRFIKETNWGEVPTSGTMQQGRMTGETLSFQRETTVSDEIRPDRQIPDLISTSISAAGDINIEFSADSYDDFLESALSNEWETEIDTSLPNTVTTDAAGDLVVSTTVVGGLDFIPGQALRISGYTGNNAVNNKIVVVRSVDETNGKLIVAPKLTPNLPASTGIRLKGQALTNGNDEISFYIQKEFTDTNDIIDYRGMLVDQMSLDISASEKVSGRFGFMGRSSRIPTATEARRGNNPTPAPTTAILVGSIQDALVLENYTAAGSIKMVTLELSNNLRTKYTLGQEDAFDIGQGRINVSGNLTSFFTGSSSGSYNSFINHTPVSLVFTLRDPVGNEYVIHMPKVLYSENNATSTGPNEDVMSEGSFQAVIDPATKKTIIITKIEA